MLRKVQITAVIVTVVGFVGAGLAPFAIQYFGSGTLHVVTAGGGAVELVVDGAPTRERSKEDDHLVYEITRGHHAVDLTDSLTGTVTHYSVDVSNGYSELLLPTRKDQCFIRFDMSEALYTGSEAGSGKQSPSVEEVFQNTGTPISVSTNVFLTIGEMPDSINSRRRIYLLRDLPCAFAVDGANPRLQSLALSKRADELFTDPDALLADDNPE
ncbi:hypothetical protein JGU66_35015 [Myxococcaceae bacterium JPH2]|nr:hypothetical protein [Myxococcaceae bacterium JPH2]